MKDRQFGRSSDERHSFGERLNIRVSRFFSETLAGLFLGACLVTLLVQAYGWLVNDAWIRLPLRRFLYLVPGFDSWQWLHRPDGWLVLHDIVTFILNFGLAAFFGLLAAVSVLIGTALREK